MLLALDYDRTYTIDTEFWDRFIKLAKAFDHEVICVTLRHEHREKIDDLNHIHIVYCGRRAKRTVCAEHGYEIDVWIDDNPKYIELDHREISASD